MDEVWKTGSLLLLFMKALDVALEKGIATSIAIVRKDNKYQYKYKVTDWDNRCMSCLGDDNNDEEIERA